jgi:uncharacterized RDD family membrane protein YckC
MMGVLMFCSQCGRENPDDARICKECHAELNVPAAIAALRDAMGYGMPEYAGFWLRFFAMITDTVVIHIGGAILAAILSPIYLLSPENTVGTAVFGVMLLGIVGFLYYPILESSVWQATLGKRLMGIHVGGLNGKRISFLRAFFRNLAKMVSSFIFGIGYIMAAFTQRKQALHDILADCLVLRGKPVI